MSGTRGDLRAELFGATHRTPPFALLLPAGWGSQAADAATLAARVDALSARVPGADHEQLRRSLEGVLAQAGTGGDDERLIGWITQQDAPSNDFAPMSMALAWLQAPAGTRITTLAGQLVAERGAAPLDPGGAILRWVERRAVAVDGGEVHTVQPTYVVRVPHTVDTALVIRTTILDGVEGSRTGDEGVAAMTALSDAIVSTFRWRRDA